MDIFNLLVETVAVVCVHLVFVTFVGPFLV